MYSALAFAVIFGICTQTKASWFAASHCSTWNLRGVLSSLATKRTSEPSSFESMKEKLPECMRNSSVTPVASVLISVPAFVVLKVIFLRYAQSPLHHACARSGTTMAMAAAIIAQVRISARTRTRAEGVVIFLLSRVIPKSLVVPGRGEPPAGRIVEANSCIGLLS